MVFCLIVDTNMLHWLTETSEDNSTIVIGFLKNQRGRLYIGGKLKHEFPSRLRSWLAVGVRAGWIVNVSDEEVDQETTWLQVHHTLESNDHHIVALARVSGARVLISRDENLRRDFGNRNLISQPRGKLLPFNADKAQVRKFLQRDRLCTQKAEAAA